MAPTAKAVRLSAVQLRPEQPETHFRLALCHAHLGLIDEAKQEFARCEELEPGFTEKRKTWKPYSSEAYNEQLLSPLRLAKLL